MSLLAPLRAGAAHGAEPPPRSHRRGATLRERGVPLLFRAALLVEVIVFAAVQAPALLCGSAATLAGATLAVLCAVLLVLSVLFFHRTLRTEPGRLPTRESLRGILCSEASRDGDRDPEAQDTSRARAPTVRTALARIYADAFPAVLAVSKVSSGDGAASEAAVAAEEELLALAVDRAAGERLLPKEAANPLESFGMVPRWCETCEVWRPVGCSHCSACGYCCLGFDHHCEVLGTCIGRRNHQSFLQLCWCSSACSFMLLLSALLCLRPHRRLLIDVTAPLLPAAKLTGEALLGLVVFLVCCVPEWFDRLRLLALLAASWACAALVVGFCLVAAGLTEGLALYTIAVCGVFWPFSYWQAVSQCGHISRGLTLKGQVAASLRGAPEPPASIDNVLAFLRASVAPSLVASQRPCK